MAKNKMCFNSAGTLKKVNRQAPKRQKKKEESHYQKHHDVTYNTMKAKEQQSKDMMARQAALETMGMQVE